MTDPMEKDLKIPNGLEEYIKQSLEAQENANDFNQCWSLKSMFAVGNDDAIKILIHSDLNQLVYLLTEAKESRQEVEQE